MAFDAIAGEAVPIKITAEETCPTPELDGVTNCPLTLAGPVFRCRHSLLVMFTAPKFQERSGEEKSGGKKLQKPMVDRVSVGFSVAHFSNKVPTGGCRARESFTS